jgi:hypothetical protein
MIFLLFSSTLLVTNGMIFYLPRCLLIRLLTSSHCALILQPPRQVQVSLLQVPLLLMHSLFLALLFPGGGGANNYSCSVGVLTDKQIATLIQHSFSQGEWEAFVKSAQDGVYPEWLKGEEQRKITSKMSL